MNRDLDILVGAIGLSALGDWLALVPLSLHLQESTGSGVLIALLFVAVWSPSILLAGTAGLLADRFDPRRVLLLVSLAQAVVALGLAFVSGAAPILVLAMLLGIGFAIAQPAEFSLVPRVAGEARLAVANGRVETSRYVGFTVGPVVGGAVAAAGGIHLAMVVNALTFVVVAVAAVVVRCPHLDDCVVPERSSGRALDGVRFLVRDRVLSIVLAVAFVSLLFMAASLASEVFFAKEDLRIGDTGYGLLLTCWTLGMALGATVVPRRIATGMLALAVLVAITVQGLGIAAPAIWLVPAFAFVLFFVGGVGHGTKNVLVRTLLHERVPSTHHGRAYAAYNALRNCAELVALLAGGFLVAAIGARGTLFLAGAAPVAAGLVALVLARRRLVEPTVAGLPA